MHPKVSLSLHFGIYVSGLNHIAHILNNFIYDGIQESLCMPREHKKWKIIYK